MNQSIRARTLIYTGVIVLICALALIIRTYKWSEFTVFNGDDGMDLSVVWNMEYQGHRPIVGPFLSIPGIYTPPTYYYLTWLFYHLSPTPDAVRIGYLCMDLLTMLILIRFLSLIGGRAAGSIGGILYATSRTLMYHGRAFWQPFPMQFFLALTLLFLWYAHKKKSPVYMWLAALCYMTAASVYPSPVILLPFMAYHICTWFRGVKKYTIARSIWATGIVLLTAAIPLFASQAMYEYLNEFPTLYTVFSSGAVSLFTTHPWYFLYWHGITAVVSGIQSSLMLPTQFWFVIPIGFLATLAAIHRLTPSQRRTPPIMTVYGFFPPIILLLGFMGVVIMRDYAPQRVWATLPILISMTSIITSRALYAGAAGKTLSLLLIAVYIYGNGSVIYRDMTQWKIHGISHTQKLAHILLTDMKTRSLTQKDVTLHYKMPDNTSHHYQLYRILYWLIESTVFSIPLTHDGNALDIDTYAAIPNRQTAYLFCEQIYVATNDPCLPDFISEHADYTVLSAYQYPYLSFYILTRK